MSLINAKLQYFSPKKGLNLYYQKWMPENPKAILIFVHGLSEHVGRYNTFTNYFTVRNYGVCMYDMRGHGKSTGRRTHVNRFYDYLYDLSQFIEFIKKESPNAPIFLVGHSLGGQIVLNFIVKFSKGVRGVVVLSPNIEHKLDLPKWKIRLGTLGAKWFPIIRVGNDIDPSCLTHDQKIVDSYANDDSIPKDLTLRCGYEIMKNSELVMALAARVHLPILLMHGGQDKLCDAEATKKFYMRVPVYSKRLKIYPNLYHELLNEREKGQILHDIDVWLEEQLAMEGRIAGSRYRYAAGA